jgi:hypothetical protein
MQCFVVTQRLIFRPRPSRLVALAAALTLAAGGCTPQAQPKGQAAQQSLASQPPQAPAVEVACPGPKVWFQRFIYADLLFDAGEAASARSLLEPGLSDCSAVVRREALAMLTRNAAAEQQADRPALERWANTSWFYVSSKFRDVGDLAIKAVLIALLTGVLWLLLSRAGRIWHRRTIAVRPLTVSNGSGFDGQHFIAIATDLHHRMNGLRRGGVLPGQSAAGPRMMLDSATFAAGAIAESLSSEPAGKLAAALLSSFRRPCFVCSGSVHFTERRTHIIIRLERWNFVIGSWERASVTARLTEDIKDLTFLALQAARTPVR